MTSSSKTSAEVKRILSLCEIYSRLEIICYDESTHNSLNRVIEDLERIAFSPETSEGVIATVHQRLLDMLNARMRLLAAKQQHQNKPEEEAKQSSKSSESSVSVVAAKSPPIVEPNVSNYCDLVPRKIKHPKLLTFLLIYAAHSNWYSQTVTVLVQDPSNGSNSIRARSVISYPPTATQYSFVSSRLVRQLNLTPIKMDRTTSDNSPCAVQVDSYVILMLKSLYRTNFRMRLLFYVLDVDYYKTTPYTDSLKQGALYAGAVLSHELWPEGSDQPCPVDLVIGTKHSKEAGLDYYNATQYFELETKDELVDIHYTHFGYCPIGSVNKKLQQQNGSFALSYA